ncbi:MAG: hypothetical protein R3B06_11125 [Kofleriaceae bacterium]
MNRLSRHAMGAAVVATLALAVAACGGKAATSPTNPVALPEAPPPASITPLARTFPGEDGGDPVMMRRPLVTVPGNRDASKAINAALGVPETAEELQPDGDVGDEFEVGYNADGLLDISIIHETMGAYPDTHTDHFLFDTSTGARLTGAALFRADAVPKLVAAIDRQLQAELVQAKRAGGDCVVEDGELFTGTFTAAHLDDVWVTKAGVAFQYPYDFPHAVQACEPAGTFVWSAKDLLPYLSDTSPLHRLVR